MRSPLQGEQSKPLLSLQAVPAATRVLTSALICFIAFKALQFSIQKISAEGYNTLILATVPPPSQGTPRYQANMSVS